MFATQGTLNNAPLGAAGLNPSDLLQCHFADLSAKARAELDAFITQPGIGPNLIAEPAKPLLWPGSPTLFSKIARSIWRTDRIRVAKDQRLEMPDPCRHFDIHLEVRVLLWKPALSLLAFYEPHPCFSQQQLIEIGRAHV